MMSKTKKIAIVYDWVDKWGGVERILLYLHELFPKAPLFTSYYNSTQASWAKDLTMKTSFIQKFPTWIKTNRLWSLPLYPYAFESFDFSEYDIVISVTSSFAKSIITKPKTFHICYLLTPTRYLWTHQREYISPVIAIGASPFLKHLKLWDYMSAQRPDTIISISKTVAERCKRFYNRVSSVIYPPFNIEYWETIQENLPHNSDTDKNTPYYLIVSRLEPYKKVDLAVDVFNTLPQRRLIIVGSGSEKTKLRHIAGGNIEFQEHVSDQDLAVLYMEAQALIMPQNEDFGYVSLEAQFFGCPVIAFKKGGACETVIEGKTGLFFDNQTVHSLRNTIERFHILSYNRTLQRENEGRKHVEQFNKRIFADYFKTAVSLHKIT